MVSFLKRHDRISFAFSQDYGLSPDGVAIGRGSNALEVAVTRTSRRPPTMQLRRAWVDRLGGRPNPLLLIAIYGDHAALCGPGGDPPSVSYNVDLQSVERISHAALQEPNRHAARRFIQTVLAGLEEELLGLRNEGLMATNYLRERMPSQQDWESAVERASPLLEKRDRDLLRGLGYEIEPLGPTHVLIARGTRVAVAVFLHSGEAFDQQQDRFVGKSPVAYALAQAEKHNLMYVIATGGGRVRLYLTEPSGAVAPRGASQTFLEIHLDILRSNDAGYLWLLFSGEALTRGGTLERALYGSKDYSANLGRRLRERIYEDVLPDLARAIAKAMGIDRPDRANLDLAFRAALTLLFRLLFVAYAEDRDLLPYRRNQRYERKSLKQKAKELLSVVREVQAFDPASTSHWSDVFALFHAISRGNKEWDVPEYDGDLFSSDPAISTEGSLLGKIEMANDAFGPPLSRLLIDWTEDGIRGPVDFQSLGVREFGVIYEGLLASELSAAEEPLKVDAKGLYLPAREGDEVIVQTGEFYMQNASGQRKSLGTFFTKDFVVEHLLNHSLEPGLADHLKRLDGLSDREAEAAFFDFRVVDIAMGSGHFLVAAVDRIERRLSAYLTERTLPGVEEELDRLQQAALRATKDQEVQTFIDGRALLRRQIARRSIYGVDLNPIAVQLARLSLWTHTFVPGLPLSFLNHNLICGDSLVGVSTLQEAAEVLGMTRESLLSYIAAEKMEELEDTLLRLGRLADADAKEIREARSAQTRLDEIGAPQQAVFDILAASRVDESIDSGAVVGSTPIEELPQSKLHRMALSSLASLRPLHFPVAFPEVFQPPRRGFDVIVGNPPWEKAKLEEHEFWARYMPGLRAMPQKDRRELTEGAIKARPDLAEQFDRERQRQGLLSKVLLNGPYPGMGIGDPDLYKAFLWRFWQLARTGGYIGVVLPRIALSGKGSETFRRHVLKEAIFRDVTFLLNNKRWVFEDQHPQYTIALLSLEKTRPSPDEELPMRGPFSSMAEFQRSKAEAPITFRQENVLQWSGSAAFPLLPTVRSAAIFRKMVKARPLGDRERSDWMILPVTELHATNEKQTPDGTTLIHFPGKTPKGFWPVYKGESFNLWTPDTRAVYGWAHPRTIQDYLDKKRKRASGNSRSAFSAMSAEWIKNKSTLPCLSPRIAFRDITNRTNRRTVIAALIPPFVVCVHLCPYLLMARGAEREEAYLLGVLSSIPLDWFARRFVEGHLTYHVFNSLPIPEANSDSQLLNRVTEIAGRLASVDERYEDWSTRVGVDFGPLRGEEMQALTEELDAVVAHLYGLAEDDLRHILETFHEGWDYQERLDGVLEHFRRWEGIP